MADFVLLPMMKETQKLQEKYDTTTDQKIKSDILADLEKSKKFLRMTKQAHNESQTDFKNEWKFYKMSLVKIDNSLSHDQKLALMEASNKLVKAWDNFQEINPFSIVVNSQPVKEYTFNENQKNKMKQISNHDGSLTGSTETPLTIIDPILETSKLLNQISKDLIVEELI
jgi:hypothetical protein